jgi:hypothetical protein
MYEATFEPTDAQWQVLEDALNTKRNSRRVSKIPKFQFSKMTNGLVKAACIVFAIAQTENTVTSSTTASKIHKWLADTKELQRALGPRHQKIGTSPKNRMELEKLYFRPVLAEREKQYFLPIPFLKRILDAAIASGELVQHMIEDPTYPASRHKELWFVWVALLATILSKAGFNVSAASGDKMSDDSPFVTFIKTIQTFLPEKCHRRKTSLSIAKGVQSAKGRYAGLEIIDLFFLLFSSGSERDYEKEPLNIKNLRSKQRLEHFLSQISSRRGTSPGNGTA